MSRSNISPKEMKLLALQSGGICAFPNCKQSLVARGDGVDGSTILGEIAHIVADSRQGPRGDAPLDSDERDKAANLILVCSTHHTLIDSQPNTFSIPVLQQVKSDHEALVKQLSGKKADSPSFPLNAETIHSTLLPVTHLPRAMFTAPCDFQDNEVG